MASLKDKSPQEINKILSDAWLGLTFNEDTLFNPIATIPKELEEEPHLYYSWVLGRPEYFSFICSEFFNIQLLPYQCIILKEMWDHKFPMLIATRGGSKTFLLAVYVMLRLLLLPGRKVVVAGAGFRQSKMVYEYCLSIWNNSPLLRNAVGDGGPKGGNDAVYIHIGDSRAIFIPIGTGGTIRGLRGDVCADEFSSHSKEIFEHVISGFGAVNASPQEKVIENATRELSINLGLDVFRQEKDETQNQIIISGTAYYYFNHFAEYWEKWKKIILSKGNKEKLEDIFQGDIPEGFCWKDYCVIRLPHTLLPNGFMDKANLARSKGTLHKSLFMMEYEACETPDTEIITKNGIKKVVDVKVGDEVLTHKNRFRKVYKLTKRPYSGKLIKLKTYGYYKDIKFTPDHPFFKNGGFIELDKIEDTLEYCNLKELSNIKNIDVKEHTYNYRIVNGFLYPQSSQSKINEINRIQIILDRENGLSYYELADKYNISYSNAWYIINQKIESTKNNIPEYLNLDYYSGICFGYYASEGSCAKGSVSFALDGHVDKSLEFFVEELSEALEKTFLLKPKYYRSQDNVVNVNINSRIVSNLFKSICPGNCYEKFMDHDILFSNKEFLRGFLIGMIHGDGHTRKNLITISLTNKNLTNQVKMAFEHFNIPCSFLKRKAYLNTIEGKEYNCKPAYKVEIYGKNYDLVLENIFKIGKQNIKRKRHKTRLNNVNNIEYQIKHKEYINYNGFVYNIEVEEDNSYSLPNCTVHNCFSKDSDGFFKATLVESCVCSSKNNIEKAEGVVNFLPKLNGDSDRKYYMGVDTASQIDNFAITIQEIHSDHRRLVYCWTTNNKAFKEAKKTGQIEETDFFRYCSRKIRDLMKKFNIEIIAIDSQGGGRTIYESLHDKQSLRPGEQMIWETIDNIKSKDTDAEEGLHIVEMVNFRNQEYMTGANNGLKKDLETKTCLFPEYNPAILATYANLTGGFAQEMEACIEDIEELKRELTQIVPIVSATGNIRYDTPEVKLSGSEKVRARKDRYSALIMSNMAARTHEFSENNYTNRSLGEIANKSLERTDVDFIGPAWLTQRYNGIYD